jgi:hypothetical protein
MNESDLNFVLALVLVVVVAIGAAGLAMSLFMQGPSSLIGLARSAVKVPPGERKIYFQTVMEAIVMARAGQVNEGYAHLLGARRRLLTLPNSDEPWVEEVANWYQQALDRYVSRHGMG